MNDQLLLRDFDYWFADLPLRSPGTSREQFNPLRDRMRSTLARVAPLTSVELDEMHELTAKHRDAREFLVTMDGGIYFNQFDFSFAMTRAVTHWSDAIGGRMIRVAREGFGQFWAQVQQLRHKVEASGADTIVVSDDGISTGQSLAEVMRQLRSQYLEVSRVDVLVNPRNIENIEGVPIRTLYRTPVDEWNHERDFFWGSRTGGISLLSANNMNALGGVPYSFSTALLGLKLGTPASAVSDVRRELLEANVEFWLLLKEAAGRTLRLRDVKRLSWLVNVFPDFSLRTPIEDAIRWFIDNDPPAAA